MDNESLCQSFLRVRTAKQFDVWWSREGHCHNVTIYLDICDNDEVFGCLLRRISEEEYFARAFTRALILRSLSFLRIVAVFRDLKQYYARNYRFLRDLITESCVDTVRYLLLESHLDPLLNDGITSLWLEACREGNNDIIDIFLELQKNPATSFDIHQVLQGFNAAYYACMYWNVSTLDRLIIHGVNIHHVSLEGVSCLGIVVYTACRYNERLLKDEAVQVMRRLLGMRIDLQLDTDTSPAAIFFRSSYQHRSVLQLLLQNSAIPSRYYLNDDGSRRSSYLGYRFSESTLSLLFPTG